MLATNGKITIANVLFPLSLITFVVFLFMAFQFSQVMRERDTLRDVRAQQDKPLEDSQKVQAQLNALAVGTKKLAQQGDKDAGAIIERMTQLGISVGSPSAPAAPAAGGMSMPVAPPPQSAPAQP